MLFLFESKKNGGFDVSKIANELFFVVPVSSPCPQASLVFFVNVSNNLIFLIHPQIYLFIIPNTPIMTGRIFILLMINLLKFLLQSMLLPPKKEDLSSLPKRTFQEAPIPRAVSDKKQGICQPPKQLNICSREKMTITKQNTDDTQPASRCSTAKNRIHSYQCQYKACSLSHC